MNLLTKVVIASAVLAYSPIAQAAIVIDFEGLNGAGYESPLDYYAGGTGSQGSTGGPDYGATFSSNTIVGCTAGNPCASTNSAGNPSGSNILFFLSGGASTLNVAGGFTTGFSFFYSAANNAGFINVYDGLDATGNILATLNLPVTGNGASLPGCFGTNFCPYTAAGVSFSGTAYSIDFGGTDNQIGFDDITIGSATAGGVVPEPASWAMMLGGFGVMGAAMRRRRISVRFAID